MLQPAETNEELDAILAPAQHSKYTPIDLKSPAELIATFHPSIQNGDIELYPWQIEEANFLAQSEFTKANPLRHILCACNGSGKDAYVIAPFAVWHAMSKIRSRCVITSSSYTQLQSQTENYIRSLCSAINDKLGAKIFIVKQMHIACTLTGSEIKLFSTDEPGRAEGYHPFPDYPKGELAIVINEGKTVGDSIFEALERCTFNRWIIISSPGKTSGRMFNDYKRADVYPEPFRLGRTYARKVTAAECPHISKIRIEQEKASYGEHHPWFRSARLAEFTSLDEAVVVELEKLQKCINFPGQHVTYGKRAGLDLAVGGDENCFLPTNGNQIIAVEAFKTGDNVVPYCIDLFTKHGFTKAQGRNIFADHGGVGAAYAQNFREKGWELSWIMNQSKPTNSTGMYGNRGAELYFNLRRLVEECLILGINDQKLISQLSSRYYTQHKATSRIILEAKREARAKGHGSPDRADALALAFCGITVDVIQDLINEQAGKIRPKANITGIPTAKEVATMNLKQSTMMEQQWDNEKKFGDSRDYLIKPLKRGSLSTAQLLSYLR